VKKKAPLLVLALATAALAGPTGPLSVPANAQAELDTQLAATWAKVKPDLDGLLSKEVTKLSGTKHGALTIGKLALTKNDTAAPPRVSVTPLTTGQHSFLFFKWGTPKYDGEKLRLDLPSGKWALELQGHVEYDLKVLFIKKHLSEDVTLSVSDLHASEELELDTTDPTRPFIKKAGSIQLDYSFHAKTSSTLLNIVLFVFKPLVDKLLSDQIQKALSKFDQELGLLVGQPGPNAWGTGAPARGAFSQQPDLEKAALTVSDEIQTVHTPYGTVVTTYFDDPIYGQGNPDHYEGYGDSAIWTGHYLAGESFRYATTKDPKAQANAARAIAAIQDLLDVEQPGGGHLARCLVPASAKDAATVATDPAAFTATLRGQSYVCLEHISRDQYLGVMHGLGCAYDLLDDPATRKQAGDLIGRIVDYLAANSWVAMRHDNVTESAPFIQSPEKMIAFSALAARVDAGKYQPMRDELGQLAWITWVMDLTGTLDPLSSYYKWNLGYGATYHAMRLETDPSRFQALSRTHAIDRRAIGHHENAYFQTIDAALDPTLAATLAPEIQDELWRFVARGRREVSVMNSTDPTIQQGTYSVPLSYQKTATSGTLVPKTVTEALYPIAVEKRPPTDFLWQRDPFQLDGGGDPKRQHPGVDLVLPYWMARYYNLVK